MMTKNEVLSGALSLNGTDKKYTVSVKDDMIITEVKWMDATFFAPDLVTDEMREFKYITKLHDNNKYSELDEVEVSSTEVDGTGIAKRYKYFKGKTITFDRTIGVGKNNIDNSAGVVDVSFYSEDYKRPVREYLQRCGYKKKMGFTAKLFLITGIIVAVIVAALFSLVFSLSGSKQAQTIDSFVEFANNAGLYVTDCSNEEGLDPAYVDAVFVGENENMYIQFWDFCDAETVKIFYDNNKNSFEEIAFSYSQEGFGNAHCEIKTKDGKFVIIAYIDDTVVFAETTEEYGDDLKQTIKEFGY